MGWGVRGDRRLGVEPAFLCNKSNDKSLTLPGGAVVTNKERVLCRGNRAWPCITGRIR